MVDLSKEEAIKLMRQGKKITHKNFTHDEWMTIQFGKIVCEDGCQAAPEEFWRWRTDAVWDNGYSLWNESSPISLKDVVKVTNQKNTVTYIVGLKDKDTGEVMYLMIGEEDGLEENDELEAGFAIQYRDAQDMERAKNGKERKIEVISPEESIEVLKTKFNPSYQMEPLI